jgi:hypothetical protein
MERNQARANFRALLQGKPSSQDLTLAEAKARLRAADPGVDVGSSLKHLNQGELKEAGLSLGMETAVALTLPCLRPVLAGTLLGLLSVTKRNRS